jgi:murein DD-endopeptidase MepM/ murein hydrolase activator NlpD
MEASWPCAARETKPDWGTLGVFLQQPYFIVVLAHSLHGRLRRIHVPHTVLYGVFALALFGFVTLAGMVSSYARMWWKVSNYNVMRSQLESLQDRYQSLQKENTVQSQQMATLQLFAMEVSSAYGIQKRTAGAGLGGGSSLVNEGRLVPTIAESVEQYSYLKSINFTSLRRSRPGASNFVNPDSVPGLWPVNGQLSSFFGVRRDPFSSLGEFHPGVDIVVSQGTPVRATADGRVTLSGWHGGYGLAIVVNHGNGLETLYGHLSKLGYLVGQEVRRGEVIGYSGSTGRATGPHVHYEVHVSGAPVNPYRYLKTVVAQSTARKNDFPF